jgi:hypothetical protein
MPPKPRLTENPVFDEVPINDLGAERPLYPIAGYEPPSADTDDALVENPVFGKPYVWENRSGEEVWNRDAPLETLYAPSLYEGGIEALTMIADLPTHVLDWLFRRGSEVLGLDPTPLLGKKATTLGDIVKSGFELPATIETAITGESPGVLARGFSATPREAKTEEERFGRDLAYILGGGLALPFGLAAAFRQTTIRLGRHVLQEGKPIYRLLETAGGRGPNSVIARRLIAGATKGPNPGQALKDAAEVYAANFMIGMGQAKWRTMGKELLIAGSAGVGYGLPELWADDNQKIMLDLGPDIGEVDTKPVLKLLTSLGMPVLLAHGPAGIGLAADKTKITPLLSRMWKKAKIFSASLWGGAREEGRQNMAARVMNAMYADPHFVETILLPAIEAGHFKSPFSKDIRTTVLPDGTVIPKTGGIWPDTVQALKEMGLDDTRLASLDAALRGRGRNPQERLGEMERRARTLDNTFELLKTRIRRGEGTEKDTAAFVEKVRKDLETEDLNNLDDAAKAAKTAFDELAPVIGGEDASRIALEFLDRARITSRGIRKELWSEENIGTEFIEASSLGDWAADQINALGRAGAVTPGMSFLLQLAGKTRLNNIGIGQSGQPLKQSDLARLTGDAENVLAAIGDNGLYDVYGAPGTITGSPVRVTDIDGLRRQVGDKWKVAKIAGEEALAGRYRKLINFIDDEVMIADNLRVQGAGEISPENLRNLEIARAYTKDAKSRFGPDSPIGKFLYGRERFDEEFLQSFISRGVGAGARVDAFRNALNEPQRPIEDAVTWEKDPAASLVLKKGDPNVIEAELLRRFTESVGPDGVVTERNVHNFLRSYETAVARIDGLRGKFDDLRRLQRDVDEMSAKLTTPTEEQILAATARGGTSADVETARRLLSENLASVRYKRIASDYLRADVDEMAQAFIRNAAIEGAGPNSFAASKADDLANMLDKDPDGNAIEGFRAALWQALRNASRNYDADQVMQPGIDTAKLTEKIRELEPFLRRFFDDNSMELLQELVKGGSLQRAGTLAPTTQVSPADVMAGRGASWGASELVGVAGRIGGQQVFGRLGINVLVATGMGKRLAGYTFSKVGEEGIYKIVEEALRDPVKAAALMKRYKELPDWVAPAKEAYGRAKTDPAFTDPKGTAVAAYEEGKGQLKKGVALVGDVVAKYSLNALQKAVTLGLLPAQREATAMTVEQDWEKGAPYIYRDNKIRAYIEAMEEDRGRPVEQVDEPGGVGGQSSVQPAVPPYRSSSRRMRDTIRGIVPASSLASARPLGPPPTAQGQPPPPAQGQIDPQQLPRMRDLGMPFFEGTPFNKGGIVSIKRKPRQLVG